ncbi:hypothetical protein Poly30_51360 [Planctomycetes bacterium Poly30]|uniref:DUF1501 domain-containing protein n=1 Tax=Saltatorellus ferox TaxID=2528018 RepID=A0A518EZR6_9BACT|nr:hypothetical protein Poly30_51360 [Planctomycetes bacterium Poly30]
MSKPISRPISRRRVLRAGALGLLAPSLQPRTFGLGRLVRASDLPPGSKQLVMIQLSGGNDGLSTIVPHGDDELYRHRKTTAHQRTELLPLDEYRAFNPRLGAFRAEFDAGRLAIVEGCGYPDPIRSHFRSMEIWHTGDHRGRASGDGWIGKLSATAWGDQPEPDSVVHFGGRAPYSVFSSTHPPVAVASPTAYRWFGEQDVYAMGGSAICEHEPDVDSTADEPVQREPRHSGRDAALRQLRKTLDDATESSARVRGAAIAYQTEVDYPGNALAASLRDVAALINGGVGTRVFSVLEGGYDTHTNQLIQHDRNMGGLGAALGAFLKDLRRTEAGKNTVVVVFSEFGRRVAENGSKGHDHGKAGPMFVFGDQVKGGLYGAHPSLTDLDDGDVSFTTDFRSVYTTVIERMFGVNPVAVLGDSYPALAFL